MSPVSCTLLIFCMILSNVHARYTDKEIDKLTEELADVLIDELGDNERDKKNLLDKRIIGGKEVEDNWPFLVSMRYVIYDEVEKGWWPFKYKETEKVFQQHFCGASLLNKEWLLTAAHCFIPNTTESTLPFVMTEETHIGNYEARLGDRELSPSLWEKVTNQLAEWWNKLFGSDLLDDWLNYEVKFEKIIIHPDYLVTKDNWWDNDIALVKLAKEVPAAPEEIEKIARVDLPQPTDDLSWPADGTHCVLKGWGCVKFEGDASEVAQRGDLPKVNDQVCSALFEGMIPVTDRICAGPSPPNIDAENVDDLKKLKKYKATGHAACPGDSGGPLLCKVEGEDKYEQAGIASFLPVYLEGRINYFPTIFTRVTRYVNWIRQTIDSN